MELDAAPAEGDYWRGHWRSPAMRAPAFAYFDSEAEALAYAEGAARNGCRAEVYRANRTTGSRRTASYGPLGRHA
jgi:hypothetical protein